MTWLCKIDPDGFVVSTYLSSEFNQAGLPCPPGEAPTGHVWRRAGEAWVAHEDRRGQMFYNPESNGELQMFTVSSLLEWPPQGWLPYGDAQREQEGLIEAWRLVRSRRQSELAESDWTDTLSARGRLGEALYAEWQAYRQALRDVTQQPDPFNITWPMKPQSASDAIFVVGPM